MTHRILLSPLSFLLVLVLPLVIPPSPALAQLECDSAVGPAEGSTTTLAAGENVSVSLGPGVLANALDCSWTACADDATLAVRADRVFVDLEDDFDFVTVYDGAAVVAEHTGVLGTHAAEGDSPAFAALTGCARVELFTDFFVNSAGFGMVITADGCRAGYRLPDGGGGVSCVACAPGEYTDGGDGADACLPCPAGSHCPGAAASVLCGAGTFGNVTGAESAAEACFECPPGSYSLDEGVAGSCPPCEPGGACPTPTTRELCPPGTFGATPGQTNVTEACAACPPGTLALGEGGRSEEECLPCPAGSACPTADAAVPCPAGTYNNATGGALVSEACLDCPAGTYSLRAGAVSPDSCQPCPRGFVCDEPSARVPCPRGTYEESGACAACPAGTLGARPAATSASACEPCPPGGYCPDPSAWVPCAAATHNPDAGAVDGSACAACPDARNGTGPGFAFCAPPAAFDRGTLFGAAPQVVTQGSGDATKAVAADFDGDGFADLLSYGGAGGALLFLGAPDGDGGVSFGDAAWSGGFDADLVGGQTLVADLDGDGDTDAFVVSTTGSGWLENVGAGGFVVRRFGTASNGLVSDGLVDADGDGDLDAIGSRSADGVLRLFENALNEPATGTFVERPVEIPAELRDALDVDLTAASLHDMNGDGVLDLLVSSFLASFDSGAGGGGLHICLGVLPRPGAVPEFPHLNATGLALSLTSGGRITTTSVGDVDGDLDNDLVVVTGANSVFTVSVLENEDGLGANGSWGEPHTLLNSTSGLKLASSVSTVALYDIDGDGDPDFLVMAEENGAAASFWLENPGGAAATAGEWTRHSIDLGGFEPDRAVLADVNADAAPDIVFTDVDLDTVGLLLSTRQAGAAAEADAAGGTLFEEGRNVTANGDGAGNPLDAPPFLAVKDFDGSGTADVAVGVPVADSDDLVVGWAASAPGGGSGEPPSFGAYQNVSLPGDPNGVLDGFVAADLDSDGWDDLVAGFFSEATVGWYRNQNGDAGAAAPFAPFQAISITLSGLTGVAVADIDGDGAPDVVAASGDDDAIVWIRNEGEGAGGAGTLAWDVPAAVATFAFVDVIEAGDIDGDGLVDVVAAALNDRVSWFRNLGDGAGFGVERLIGSAVDLPSHLVLADLDSDGDDDVLICSRFGGVVAWHESLIGEQPGLLDGGGSGFNAAARLVANGVASASYVVAADLDLDGDLDVASVSDGETRAVVWAENRVALGGAADFAPLRTVAGAGPAGRSVAAADIDGDGLVDLVAATNDGVRWYRNAGTGARVSCAAEGSLTVPGCAGRVAAAAGAASVSTLVSLANGGTTVVGTAVSVVATPARPVTVVVRAGTGAGAGAGHEILCDLQVAGPGGACVSLTSVGGALRFLAEPGAGPLTVRQGAARGAAAALDAPTLLAVSAAGGPAGMLRVAPPAFLGAPPRSSSPAPSLDVVNARAAGGPAVLLRAGDGSSRVRFASPLSVRGSSSSGGAVATEAGSSAVFFALEASDSAAGGCLAAGGAVAVRALRLERCSASGRGDGGGALVSGAGASLVVGSGGGVVTSCSTGAGGAGGGLAVRDGGALRLLGAVAVTGCTANTFGGGVSCSGAGSTFEMAGGSLSNNTAALSGGGLNAAVQCEAAVSGGATLNGNAATAGSGGAAFVERASLSVDGGEAAGNSAAVSGGAFHSTVASLDLGGALEVRGNAAGARGGGVFGEASDQADTPRVVLGGAVAVTGNTAGEDGGGVYAEFVDVTVAAGATVANNTAARNGGGVYARPGARTLLVAGQVRHNLCAGGSGGGVYLAGDASGLAFEGGGSVTGNAAPEGGGGGVFWTPPGQPPAPLSAVTGNAALYSADTGTRALRLEVLGRGAEEAEQRSRDEPLSGTLSTRLVDYYNETVLADSSTRVTVFTLGDLFDANLFGALSAPASRGAADFTGALRVEALPGSEAVLGFRADAADAAGVDSEGASVTVRMAPCLPGEFVEGSLRCAKCGAGSASAGGLLESCEPCAPGRFANETGMSECPECARGTAAPAAGAAVCRACPRGEFAGADGRSACDECAAGRFQNATGSSACAECGPGTFSPIGGLLACLPCAPGTFGGGDGLDACEPCATGRVQPADGATSCEPCPEGEFTSGAGARFCETCPASQYLASGSTCLECPPLARCNGRTVEPVSGAWLSRDEATGEARVFECLPGLCEVDAESGETTCGDNRLPADENPLCADCVDDSFTVIKGVCVRCESVQWGLLAALYAAALVAVALLHSASQGDVAAVKILLYFVQSAALFLGETEALDRVSESVVNLDLVRALGGNGCTLPMSDERGMLAGFLSAGAMLLLVWPSFVAIAYGLDRAYNRAMGVRPSPAFDVTPYLRTLVELTLSLLNIVLLTSVEVFDTRDVRLDDGSSSCRVRAHPSVRCAESTYDGYVAVAAVLLSLYAAVVAVFARQAYRHAGDEEEHGVWTVMTEPFAGHGAGGERTVRSYAASVWQLVIVVRRVAVVLTFALMRSRPATEQLSATAAVSVFFLVVHALVNPFSDLADNAAETLSLATLATVLLLLLSTAGGEQASNLPDTASSSAALVLGYAVAAALLLHTVRERARRVQERRQAAAAERKRAGVVGAGMGSSSSSAIELAEA